MPKVGLDSTPFPLITSQEPIAPWIRFDDVHFKVDDMYITYNVLK